MVLSKNPFPKRNLQPAFLYSLSSEDSDVSVVGAEKGGEKSTVVIMVLMKMRIEVWMRTVTEPHAVGLS